MPSVHLNSVSRRFGDFAAVKDVTAVIPDGAFVTLLGPSGCGKTTTLRMIAGLESNTGGVISIGDSTVSDPARGIFLPPEKRNAGMVFQSYAIWPHMTVFDNVAYPLRLRRLSRQEVHAKTMRALDLVKMSAYAERPAPLLSGGQQQRVAIARAIAFEPSVLLFDEPLSNLDAKLRDEMRIELRALQQRLAITTVFVTHDQEEAMALSDRIIVMRQGAILQNDTPEGIYFRPAPLNVAEFCTNSTIIPATVISSEAGRDSRILEVQGDGWSGRVQASDHVAQGRPVSVIVRAESIRVDASPVHAVDQQEISWRGRVEKNVFRGSRRTLIVRVGDTAFTVDAAPENDVGVDRDVTLSVTLGDTWSIPAATTSARTEAA
ncbi:ABC transporter ATP-binding protein [Rhodopseudomonas sp. BAL398]|uniref:ABC transporter ATP-binding protein n=1 Tax=Rhodopseudomonas sp. BAL398 TaxID=3034676 RepID=UPI0023E226BB|nr:ABC transporter ATP-binding protein [Rhodopseudomonas sp. BAL398]MDF3811601.1 ABC transporter ATP-binding protein [Rhodopseudomonas sp. BAL398]